jgi:hypothetical protein
MAGEMITTDRANPSSPPDIASKNTAIAATIAHGTPTATAPNANALPQLTRVIPPG